MHELETRKESVKRYMTLFSPGRRIPLELLEETFALTLPFTRRIGQHTTEQALWQLGHVCQRWRAATWSILHSGPPLRFTHFQTAG